MASRHRQGSKLARPKRETTDSQEAHEITLRFSNPESAERTRRFLKKHGYTCGELSLRFWHDSGRPEDRYFAFRVSEELFNPL
jgi:hypothetical protein